MMYREPGYNSSNIIYYPLFWFINCVENEDTELGRDIFGIPGLTDNYQETRYYDAQALNEYGTKGHWVVKHPRPGPRRLVEKYKLAAGPHLIGSLNLGI